MHPVNWKLWKQVRIPSTEIVQEQIMHSVNWSYAGINAASRQLKLCKKKICIPSAECMQE